MSIIRVVGYVGAVQELVMPAGYSANATAYLWGGGGGGGGSDASGQGGAGQGGGFVQQTLTLNPGDSLKLAVGGGGGGGYNSTGGGAGTAGASIIPSTLFDTRAQNDVSAVADRSWGNFINTHGVWGGGYSFTRNYSVYFPYTGYYTFYASADDTASISLDGGQIITTSGTWTSYQGLYNYTVSQGYHTISFTAVNSGGGPAGFALVITNNSVNGYSGGRGGVAGPSGSSGGGGGGGGATVLQLNNTVIAVAGGGAGGGGAGNGPNGGAGGGGTTAPFGTPNGQNGQDKTGDGGGGGAGGGGYRAGNGGYCGSGDVGGGGGGSSTSYGTVTANPTGRVPGSINSTYYPGNNTVAYGGAPGNGSPGGPGYAVIELVPHTILVHKDGVFYPALNTYLKVAGQWQDVFGVFLKINGEWVPVAGVNSNYAPVFATNTNNFGINARGIDPESTPYYPSQNWFGYFHNGSLSGFGDGGGGGGGGSKIICTKLYELGLMSKDIYEADQAFGAELVQTRPDIYNGYRAWAEIVVNWMDGGGPKMMPWMTDAEFSDAAREWSTAWAKDIATPWAEEMAYRMGRKDTGSLTGRMIMAAGIPICKAVGVWQRWFGPSKKPAGFGKGLMLIPVFVMFKLVAKLGRLIERK